MLTDLLVIAFFFFTRVGLPIVITYLVGVGIERALNCPSEAKTLHALAFPTTNLQSPISN